jgi:hypothetical protein
MGLDQAENPTMDKLRCRTGKYGGYQVYQVFPVLYIYIYFNDFLKK